MTKPNEEIKIIGDMSVRVVRDENDIYIGDNLSGDIISIDLAIFEDLVEWYNDKRATWYNPVPPQANYLSDGTDSPSSNTQTTLEAQMLQVAIEAHKRILLQWIDMGARELGMMIKYNEDFTKIEIVWPQKGGDA